MSVVVVTAPEPLVTAAQAKAAARVLAGDDDASVDALLAVAQTALEPPSWLGSALGKQTLELRAHGWPCDWRPLHRLPYGPVLSIDEVKYLDAAGQEQTLDPTIYDLAFDRSQRAALVLRDGHAWPATAAAWNAVRITYKAGHEASDPRLSLARHAIILSAVQLRSLSSVNLALRSVEVPGVETRTYVVSDAAEKLVRNAVASLLSSFRVYSI